MKNITDYVKRMVWLIPGIVCAIVCIYFGDLLHTLRLTTNPATKATTLKELSFGIGFLLLFTVIFNWYILAYAKNLRFKYKKQSMEKKKW